jgi:hypothetical protein
MSFSKADVFFLTPVTSVFIAALALLVVASSVSVSSSGHELIGTITYKNHYAERKLTSQVMWNALAQNSPVYNGDTIHTTSGASAILHLGNQMAISMGEETLLRLDVAPQKTDVRLDGGIISVRKPSQGQALAIATAAGKIDVKDGELSVQENGKALQVSVIAGQANVDSGKTNQTLSAGASLELQSGAIRTLVAQLLEPPAGSTIYRASDDSPTRLRWAFSVSAQNGQTQAARLIVASDSAFKQVESSQVVNASEISLTLGPGTHYWKIQTPVNGDGPQASGESTVGWFHLLEQDSPLPIEPQDRSFSIGKVPPLVSFSWSDVANASAYRFEIVDKNTGAAVVSRVISRTSIGLDTLGKGDYSWSVSAICGSDNKEFTGAKAFFSIASRAVPPPSLRSSNMIVAQTEGPSVSIEALHRGAILASWDDVAGADYYEARIAKDSKGTAPLCQTKTTGNALSSPIALAPGDYYVQVRSISGDVASDFSEAAAFTVTDPQTIVTLSPPEGFVADPIQRRLRFSWKDPNDSGQVKLQLSTEPSFAHPLLDQPSAASDADIKIPEGASGKIYWRVAATSAELGLSSAARSFRMPDLLAAPRITSPAEGLVLDIGSIEKLRLGWEASPGANRYLVSLYQLIGSKRSLVQSWGSAEPFVSIPRLRQLGIGQFAWTVSATRVSGGEILARSPEETAYFSVSHSHPLPPPVVHRPSSGA